MRAKVPTRNFYFMWSSTSMYSLLVVGLFWNPRRYPGNICKHPCGGFSYFIPLSGHLGCAWLSGQPNEYAIIGIIVVFRHCRANCGIHTSIGSLLFFVSIGSVPKFAIIWRIPEYAIIRITLFSSLLAVLQICAIIWATCGWAIIKTLLLPPLLVISRSMSQYTKFGCFLSLLGR